jgi:hypothetical protein
VQRLQVGGHPCQGGAQHDDSVVACMELQEAQLMVAMVGQQDDIGEVYVVPHRQTGQGGQPVQGRCADAGALAECGAYRAENPASSRGNWRVSWGRAGYRCR